MLQVGYLEKGKMYHLYIQAKDHDMRESWKIHVRKREYNSKLSLEQNHVRIGRVFSVLQLCYSAENSETLFEIYKSVEIYVIN